MIAVATEAFLADGYGTTSLDTIARTARISKKTIYQFFSSKEELFRAVVEQSLQSIPRLELSGACDDDPAAALRMFLLPVAAVALSENGLRFHWMIMREANIFPELIKAFTQGIEQVLCSLFDWMESKAAKGRLAFLSPHQAGIILLRLLLDQPREEFALKMRSAPSPAEQAEMVDTAIRLFLYGSWNTPARKSR